MSVDPMFKSGSTTSRRPMSSYGLAADVTGPGWDRGDARRSVMVGNGTGVFLAVPGQGGDDGAFGGSSDPWRPQSSGGSPRRSRELW